jgi:hypothetical protein
MVFQYFRLGHEVQRVHDFTSDSVNLYYFLLYIISRLNNFKESRAGKKNVTQPQICKLRGDPVTE